MRPGSIQVAMTSPARGQVRTPWSARPRRTHPPVDVEADVRQALHMLIAHLRSDAAVVDRPAGARHVATLPARTPWLGTQSAVQVVRVSPDGDWGRIRVPWQAGAVDGWISLRGARLQHTDLRVSVSLARRVLEVHRGAQLVARMRAGIGAASSPTPTGRYVVSDRSRPDCSQRSRYGTFAFGMSGVQPRPPAGWRGPAQLAIHGTGDPASIGRAASAGCVRVSEAGLRLLRPLLAVGTPVIVTR